MDSNTPLELPTFDIPDLPSKPMTTEAYRAWLLANRRRLLETGQLESILADSLRLPVDVRFSLDE